MPSPTEPLAAAPAADTAPVTPGSWAAKAMKPAGPAPGAPWGKPTPAAQPAAAQTVPDLSAANSFPGLGPPAAPVGNGVVSTISARRMMAPGQPSVAEMAASIPEPAPEAPSLLDVSAQKVDKKALKKLRKQQQQAAREAEAEASRAALAAMDSEKLGAEASLASMALSDGPPGDAGGSSKSGGSGLSRRAQERLEEAEKEKRREKKEEEQLIKQRIRMAKSKGQSWSKDVLENQRHRSGASRRRMGLDGEEEE